ncbi:alpha/beta fold hydrolase [Pullulanibacillus sp. KACC 23026]|uniref:alpha/beta fold hydrolase n=1 Tax=Pullulanibacillus sp. KACC 23026 TaxID=3028315 RepID=UPI0023AEB9DC|nr:alpha/beta fold hydrolase [Pullulanibacillus sp. KACC 23026]WEG11484.1 alpha/beta fold hydrolase [Pullulanibacillus sp. KACC 23026]
MTLITETVIDGIPVLHSCPPDKTGTLPTVFIYHGWASSKEAYRLMGTLLSALGYQVILPDLPKHGGRYEEKDLQKEFWSIIFSAVEEFALLLRYTKAHWQVDPRITAVLGSSAGGLVVSGIFAHFPEIYGLIAANGSGAWEEAERLFRELDGRTTATEEEMKPIREKDPVSRLKTLPLRPVLLQHGSSDSIVPIGGTKYFYEALRDVYKARHELITYQEIPRLDHYISLGMLGEMVDWLNLHLKGESCS